ncbi:DUF4862 family protein, partial [Escherichia coli]|uniref:DUF4862 family protein n=1 Tax=Escherichia coli TaxID=562 RepID=UPI00211912A4
PPHPSRFCLSSSDESPRQACVAYYRHLFNKINALQANKVLALALQAAPLATNPILIKPTADFPRKLKKNPSWAWPCNLLLK